MSTAIQSSARFCEHGCSVAAQEITARGLARRISQAIVLLPLFSLMLLPEYVQGVGDPESKSWLYQSGLGPLRWIDLILLAVTTAHAVGWASTRRRNVVMLRSFAVPAGGFASAVSISMVYGLLHGGTNLFFDWRAIALGAGLYMVFCTWISTAEQAQAAIVLFAFYMAVRIGFFYAAFLGGGGDVLIGVRIPVFDGPTVSAIGFTAILALAMSDSARSRLERWPWIALASAACLLVLLCFRRTFWTELGIATALLLLMRDGGLRRKVLLPLAILSMVALTLGPVFYARVQSLDFTVSDSEFSQGNSDHVGEVLDAWDQVRRRPILGIGLGRSFETPRIQNWKEESVMVHNAPLHVWLKYGLLGLVCYLWFHFVMLRWLWRRRRGVSADFDAESLPAFYAAERALPRLRSDGIWVSAAFAYLTAQFVVTLGFTPWPYSSLQSTTLIAFILATARAVGGPWKHPQFR